MEDKKQQPQKLHENMEPKLYEIKKEDMQEIRKQSVNKQKSLAHVVTGDVITSTDDL